MKKLTSAGCAFITSCLLAMPVLADLIVDPRPVPQEEIPVDPHLTPPVDVLTDTSPALPMITALAVSVVVIAAAVLVWTVRRRRR